MRIDKEPAFILHARFYKETSLLLDVFTQNHGRLSMIAKGARRPHSELRGKLLSFQPLEVGFYGKNELKNLTRVEWQGGVPLPQGEALFCAYYANELLRFFLQPADSNARLFEEYFLLISALGAPLNAQDLEKNLRNFEVALLKLLGYSPFWGRDSKEREIVANCTYRYQLENATLLPETAENAESSEDFLLNGIVLSGQTLIDLSRREFENPATRREAKFLMRRIFAYHLDGKNFLSREILREMHGFKNV